MFFTIDIDKEDLLAGLNIYKDTKIYLVVSGWVGAIIGWVAIGANIEDLDALGPGLAVSLLTILYGYVFAYFVCFPVIRRIQYKLEQ